MRSPAIPESPTARLLLELALARASCEVALGARTLILVEGSLVELRPSPEDRTLLAFLTAAGRIDDAARERVEARVQSGGRTLEQALAELPELEPETLLETRRALFLDRLVLAFAALEAHDADALPVTAPLRTAARGPVFDLVSLVLDALARRAAFGAAEIVGEMRRARFVWVETAAQRRAASWAELGDIPHAMSVATLFPRHPAAPSRIAALVRASVARLDENGVSAAPAAKVSVKPAPPLSNSTVVVAPVESPARVETVTARAGETAGHADAHAEAPARTLAPARSGMPAGSDAPAAASASKRVGPLALVPNESWLPRAHTTLSDPLLPLEQSLAELVRTEAVPAARTAAWLALAQVWSEQQSSAEATRAAREAAAADPNDPLALAAAARLAGATGAPEMAYAYARGWANAVSDPGERARALRAAADYAQRAERPHDQREALRAAVQAAPHDAGLQEQLAYALARDDEVATAVEHARLAAELLRADQPGRTRALLAWAATTARNNLRAWNDLAKNLVRGRQHQLGVAWLAHAARLQSDSAIRERLRLSAIAFAELALQRDLAIEVLLEAVESGSALSEPLLTHLHAAGAWAELALIAEQLAARAKGSERAALLAAASAARLELAQGPDPAIELLTEALAADPESAGIYEALTALCDEHGRLQARVDALERALRVHEIKRDNPVEELDRLRKLALLLQHLRELPSDATTAPLMQLEAECTARLTGREPDADTTSALREHQARFERVAQRLEQELRAAGPQERTPHALRLAALCRQDPARRATARKLYEMVLGREPMNRDAQHGLEGLLRLSGDEAGLDALALARSERAPSAMAQLAVAYRHRRAGRLEGALAACEAALASAADQPALAHEARVLRWRLAGASGHNAPLFASLRALASAAEQPQRAALLWMRLARGQRNAGERAAAVATAETALATDPECAEAALSLLHDITDLALAPKIELLRSLRAVLGDSPELLRQLARASFTAADPRGQREALEQLATLVPHDGFAARSLVALQTTGRDAQALGHAIERALEPARFGKQTPSVVQQGLVRLAALSGVDSAVKLLLASVEPLGERVRPLLMWAAGVAQQLGSRALHIALLEQLVAHGGPELRLSSLQKLAALHAQQGTLWAAVRTELRLLALAPNDTAALERLASLYAETGELTRLDAALLLLCERATTDEERRARLFDRAAFLVRLAGDADAACKLIEQAFAVDERDGRDPSLVSLREGVGLLLADAPEHAFTLLLGLAQRATAERARDLIDEAILLAEQGLSRPDLALNAASQGTLRQPQHEPFVAALERLSRGAGQLERLVTTLEEAAERCDELPRQAELLLRAASLSELELDDAVRASVLLDRAYRATPTVAIEALVLATAGRLFARDVRAGKLAFDRLRDTLHVRAKFGNPAARAHALSTLGRLAFEIYLNREEALGYVEAARTALHGEVAEAEREPVLQELEELSHRLIQTGATVRPLSRAPEKARKSLVTELDAPLVGFSHTAPTFRPAAGSLAPPNAATPIARILPPTEARPLVSLAPFELRAHAGSTSSESLAQVSIREVHTEPEALARAVAEGDTAALKPLSELLQREPGHAERVSALLLARARAGGFHVCALRGLRQASAAANEHALWRTSSQALALVEPPLRPPPSTRRRDARSSHWDGALNAARSSEHAAVLSLLAQLVESAAPLFRKSVTTVVGVAKEPEPLREAPYAPLLNDLAQTFGARHDAYLARSGEDRVSLVSVQPAQLIIGDRTSPDTASLRFRLARAFEYARAENVLLATLSQTGVTSLLAALSAAFADSAPAHVSREAAALAADLWRTMPSKAQKAVTAQLKSLPLSPSPAELIYAVQVRSVRVALFATRDLEVALAQLGLDGDAPELRIDRTEGSFNRALQDKPLVRALMSYAFSEPYLQAVVEDS